MARKSTSDQSQSKGNNRDARLKAALKSNMARRKAQARARSVQKSVGTGKAAPPQSGGESR